VILDDGMTFFILVHTNVPTDACSLFFAHSHKEWGLTKKLTAHL
jgi:hypothetical protein